VRRLIHGVIMHGEQYLTESKRRTPTTYYSATSGAGRALKAMASPDLRVGVVGLGTGTLAAYGRPGNVFRFYEINPQVVDIAQRHFTFLGDSPAKIEIALGDARLSMEREAPQNFDLLAIDAFSSDSIPVHLLTRESMAVYLRHLKPDGVIAFHVTNRFLDLAPVVKRIADEQKLHTMLIPDEDGDEASSTDWVLLTRNQALLEKPELAKFRKEIGDIPGLRVWTDDFNNLFQILK
jgi:SAM-dependent methyltransferase